LCWWMAPRRIVWPYSLRPSLLLALASQRSGSTYAFYVFVVVSVASVFWGSGNEVGCRNVSLRPASQLVCKRIFSIPAPACDAPFAECICCCVCTRRVLAGFNGTDPNVSGMLGLAMTIQELCAGPLKGADPATVTVSCQGVQLGTARTAFNPLGNAIVRPVLD
jgi:hypothetical protein